MPVGVRVGRNCRYAFNSGSTPPVGVVVTALVMIEDVSKTRLVVAGTGGAAAADDNEEERRRSAHTLANAMAPRKSHDARPPPRLTSGTLLCSDDSA
jgi:hypothetical protein